MHGEGQTISYLLMQGGRTNGTRILKGEKDKPCHICKWERKEKLYQNCKWENGARFVNVGGRIIHAGFVDGGKNNPHRFVNREQNCNTFVNEERRGNDKYVSRGLYINVQA
jgi:hypothetical protein